MENALKQMLGVGMRFPFLPTEYKNLQMTEEIERINQSLLMLLETPKGSRLFVPDYGTNLRLYRFEPNDDILVEELKQSLIIDVQKWEPRLNIADIRFYRDSESIDNNILYVHISYTVMNSDVQGNFVYPYRVEPYDSVENDVIGGNL